MKVRLPKVRDGLVEVIEFSPTGPAEIASIIKQAIFFSLGALTLYLLAPQIQAVLLSGPALRDIRVSWFLVAVASQVVSFLCMWWLTRIVLPSVSWFVAATAQLTSNAVSRMVPGGAAIGGATLYRMLAVSGVQPAQAGGALAATSIISTGLLFALPAAGLLIALLGAPIPAALWPAAVAGAVLFGVLMGLAAVAFYFTRPLLVIGGGVDWVLRRNKGRFGQPLRFERDRLVTERDRLVSVIDTDWPKAMVAATLNWVLDYFSLVACLYAVGADPRLSLVLVAFSGAAVLAMIPITPGGFGFVEAGLVPMLLLSGVNEGNALIATLAYRIVSLWLPIVSGVAAWFVFRWRFPKERSAVLQRKAAAAAAAGKESAR